MKLYVPRLGDVLQLTTPWSFELHRDTRNVSVWQLFGLPYDTAVTQYDQPDIPDDICELHDIKAVPVTVRYIWQPERLYSKIITLPVGAQLKVDRIYIRKGSPQYDSMTFSIVKKTIPNFTSGKARFWTQLDDANTMEFDKV